MFTRRYGSWFRRRLYTSVFLSVNPGQHRAFRCLFALGTLDPGFYTVDVFVGHRTFKAAQPSEGKPVFDSKIGNLLHLFRIEVSTEAEILEALFKGEDHRLRHTCVASLGGKAKVEVELDIS